jgi:hypothetical protein
MKYLLLLLTTTYALAAPTGNDLNRRQRFTFEQMAAIQAALLNPADIDMDDDAGTAEVTPSISLSSPSGEAKIHPAPDSDDDDEIYVQDPASPRTHARMNSRQVIFIEPPSEEVSDTEIEEMEEVKTENPLEFVILSEEKTPYRTLPTMRTPPPLIRHLRRSTAFQDGFPTRPQTSRGLNEPGNGTPSRPETYVTHEIIFDPVTPGNEVNMQRFHIEQRVRRNLLHEFDASALGPLGGQP